MNTPEYKFKGKRTRFADVAVDAPFGDEPKLHPDLGVLNFLAGIGRAGVIPQCVAGHEPDFASPSRLAFRDW